MIKKGIAYDLTKEVLPEHIGKGHRKRKFGGARYANACGLYGRSGCEVRWKRI